MRCRLALALAFGLLGIAAPAAAQDAAPAAPPLPRLVEAVRVQGVGTGARSLVHTDAIEAELVAGTWAPPRSGAELELPDGTMRRFTTVRANTDGVFEGDVASNGSWLSFRVPSPSAQTVLLHAVGHDFVYVNGTLRPGDPYGYGWWRLPIALRAGDNELLFRASRGRFRATLLPATDALVVELDDRTVGDVDPDEPAGPHGRSVLGAVVVTNTTSEAVGPVRVEDGGSPAGVNAFGEAPRAAARWIPPLSRVKLPFRVTLPDDVTPFERDPAAGGADADAIPVRLRVRAGALEARGDAAVRIRRAPAVRRLAYTSAIDGSVQYVAVRPATGPGPAATLLSLHGASVEATGQAESYAPKPWALVAAPTNRRPFGFDWEDWGRIDAFEALAAVRERYPTDEARTYLTGHSMGGHGTWQLGVTFPGEWAAVGPSAGWVSFFSYGGATAEEKDPVVAMLRRAAAPSDTLALVENLRDVGVYALHGDADDNVPVTEMRTMLGALAPFHRDVLSHEQKGAGHWWDASPAPGADCVDWGPMLAFFARRARVPAWERDVVDFATMHPGVSSRLAWASVEAAVRPFERSRVRLARDVAARRVEGTTENVAALGLALDRFAGDAPVTLVLDGTTLSAPVEGGAHARAWLERRDGAWALAQGRREGRKTPARCGAFKAAFDRQFVLVYGTFGTPQETAWGLEKARLDAEAWLYRGNGLADVVPDTEFLEGAAGPARYAHRNVILYGNRDTNRAWPSLLGDGPVTVRRDRVVVGTRVVEGDALACLFVRPRPGDDVASVGVVAGTGLPGLRLTERLPYLASGVGVPDLVVLSAAMLEKGAEGVLGAGFFGDDWGVETGTIAWR